MATGPIEAVVAIHNAFRRDMAEIDAAALGAARGKPGLAATVERFRFFNEVLEWHAHGEEAAVFTAVEGVAPLVAEAYAMDHRGLDAAFDSLSKAGRRGRPRRSSSISTFTCTRKTRTCTASSKNACRCLTRPRRSASWPAPYLPTATRSSSRGCSRCWVPTTART